MSIWIVIFALAFAAAVVFSRRASKGTHGRGCHGGAHVWPPDDITDRSQPRRRQQGDATPVPPTGEPPLRAKAPPERELAGVGSGSASHNGHRHGC